MSSWIKILYSSRYNSSKYYDLAKWLSYYLYFFSFLFIFGLIIQKKSMGKYYMIYDISYDECRKVVYKPYSRYISSI